MKVVVTIKDPDRFYEAAEEAVKGSLAEAGLDEEEQEALIEVRTARVWKGLERWVEYQEYVVLEFDTDAGTATVRTR